MDGEISQGRRLEWPSVEIDAVVAGADTEDAGNDANAPVRDVGGSACFEAELCAGLEDDDAKSSLGSSARSSPLRLRRCGVNPAVAPRVGVGIVRRFGEEKEDDTTAGLEIKDDIILKADMISALKESKLSRVMKSLRIFISVL